MIVISDSSFQAAVRRIKNLIWLQHSNPIEVGKWHAQDVSGSQMHLFHEILNVNLAIPVASTIEGMNLQFQPNQPWADKHFRERVSGIPHNPPPSHNFWPFAKKNNGDHLKDAGKFSHTYPERFWPRYAGNDFPESYDPRDNKPNRGIRYDYGDLDDVVSLLRREPLTRQAYLPVWFPEDTGAAHSQRVPCTLGYQFLIRQRRPGAPLGLSCTYFMRSCDLYRHFNDDLYMAARLMGWVVDQLNPVVDVKLDTLNVSITNLHVLSGDMPRLRAEVMKIQQGVDLYGEDDDSLGPYGPS